MMTSFGPIEDLTMLQNYQTGRCKGCGFVKFSYREDAIRAFVVSFLKLMKMNSMNIFIGIICSP